jgi:bis(5'-nucleosidyl)-tetraphosphatase
MVDERSVGAIMFMINTESDMHEYLLLHYTAGHWDFPKGNAEAGEKELDTASREIHEETGIEDVKFLEGFRKKIDYHYRREYKLIQKEVIYYIAETSTREVRLSNEHIGYSWEDYHNAMYQLTYKNAKDLLKEAEIFIRNAYRI